MEGRQGAKEAGWKGKRKGIMPARLTTHLASSEGMAPTPLTPDLLSHSVSSLLTHTQITPCPPPPHTANPSTLPQPPPPAPPAPAPHLELPLAQEGVGGMLVGVARRHRDLRLAVPAAAADRGWVQKDMRRRRIAALYVWPCMDCVYGHHMLECLLVSNTSCFWFKAPAPCNRHMLQVSTPILLHTCECLPPFLPAWPLPLAPAHMRCTSTSLPPPPLPSLLSSLPLVLTST
jgi:hypothetical protein